MVEQQKYFDAKMCNELANNYIDRGELTNVISDIVEAAKHGKFAITTNGDLFQSTITKLVELGYEVEELRQHGQCSIFGVLISWHDK